MPLPAPQRSSHCRICSYAPSSLTLRASCCRSPIPLTSSYSASRCRHCWTGCASSRCLRLMQRRALDSTVATVDEIPPLTLGGKLAASGITMTAIVLLTASTLGWDLGLPTFIAGAAVTTFVLAIGRQSPLPVLKDISWSVLPLVAGLFILVEGLNRTGVPPSLAGVLKEAATASPHAV